MFPYLGFGAITIFLILSGYGNFQSLENKLKKNIKIVVYAKFYLKRFIRIFPMYWLAIYLDLFVFKIHAFPTIAIIGFQNISVFWFISLIIQCYIVSIPLYIILKKLDTKRFLILIGTCVVFINILYLSLFANLYNNVTDVYRLFFGNILFLHIFLFSFGLSLKNLISKCHFHFKIKSKYEIAFILIFYIILCSLFNYFECYSISIIYSTLIIALSLLLVVIYLVNLKSFPLPNIFNILGRYTFSLYLFHEIYYKIIFDNIASSYNIFTKIFMSILILPAFFSSCFYFEEFYRFITRSKDNFSLNFRKIMKKYITKTK